MRINEKVNEIFVFTPHSNVLLIDQLSWLKNVIGGDFIVAMRLYTLLVFTFIDFKWNNCLRDARKEAVAYIIKRKEASPKPLPA